MQHADTPLFRFEGEFDAGGLNCINRNGLRRAVPE